MWWCGISLVYLALLGWTPCQSRRLGVSIVEYNVCENITVPLCKNLPYNCTKMPNMFHHRTQEDANVELNQFKPLVNVGCSASLQLFLCSVYLPKYTLSKAGNPPCRSLCEKVKQGCEGIMNRFNYTWPQSLNCSLFPLRGESPCLEAGGRVVTKSVSTSPPTGARHPVCEPLKFQMCKTKVNDMTSVPNLLGHATQDTAILHLEKFRPLLANATCSAVLKPYLCSIYLPRCNSRGVSVPPCRSLCRRAQQLCGPLMTNLTVSWPVKCGNHPKPSQRACLKKDGSLAKPPHTSPPPTSNSSPTCEPITASVCRDIGYNNTKMPNLLGIKTQEIAGEQLEQFSPLIHTNCSPHVKLFLCSLYTPMCENGTVRKPCRSLCEKVRSGCESLLKTIGFYWPKEQNCNLRPTPAMEACVSENGTLKNNESQRVPLCSSGGGCHKGSQKVPFCSAGGGCHKVSSAVFPVTLKCQRPDKRFTIQKISLLDKNGKKTKVRYKKDNAHSQCNASRRKMQAGYECDLTDPSRLGISSDAVFKSVLVLYKCSK